MTDHQPTDLLGLENAALEERTPFCPADDAIAEYYKHTLAEDERASVQRHLADCRYCQARIGMLSRLEENPSESRVPEDLLAKAKQLVDPSSSKRWILTPGWAAAVIIVLTLGLVIIDKTRLVGPIPSPPDETRQLRNIDGNALVPKLLAPTEGALVDPAQLEIRWSAVQGSMYYDLYLMSDAGNLLLQERLTGTLWKAGETLPLVPGSEYFVRVEAHLPDTGTASSRHVIFKVRAED